MHDGSDSTSPYTSDLLVAQLQMLLVYFEKGGLQLLITPDQRLLDDLSDILDLLAHMFLEIAVNEAAYLFL